MFTGMRIALHLNPEGEGGAEVSMDQESDLLAFLESKGLDSEKLRENPVGDKKTSV